MMQVLPNTGIFGNDSLDRLRGDALTACDGGLPEPLVYYLRALEESYLGLKADQKRRAVREIGWKHGPVKEASASSPSEASAGKDSA